MSLSRVHRGKSCLLQCFCEEAFMAPHYQRREGSTTNKGKVRQRIIFFISFHFISFLDSVYAVVSINSFIKLFCPLAFILFVQFPFFVLEYKKRVLEALFR